MSRALAALFARRKRPRCRACGGRGQRSAGRDVCDRCFLAYSRWPNGLQKSVRDVVTPAFVADAAASDIKIDRAA